MLGFKLGSSELKKNKTQMHTQFMFTEHLHSDVTFHVLFQTRIPYGFIIWSAVRNLYVY